MAKAERLALLDTRRTEIEAEYHLALVAALRRTASGKWGLFGHRIDRHAQAKLAPVVEEIVAMGEEIDRLREQLSMDAFELHREFLASRGPVGAHEVGEPKQAQAWLARIEAGGNVG